MNPPRLATWLLGWLEDTCSPLVGDLHEEWRNGRSAGWFWRQTMSVLSGRAAKYVAEHRPLAFLGLVAIGLYWVGTHVPLPGVNTDALAPVTGPGAFGLFDLFTGGNLGRGTIFALGITPYVSALCIAYLATALGLARGRGARGRRAMAWSVRGVALVLGCRAGDRARDLAGTADRRRGWVPARGRARLEFQTHPRPDRHHHHGVSHLAER